MASLDAERLCRRVDVDDGNIVRMHEQTSKRADSPTKTFTLRVRLVCAREVAGDLRNTIMIMIHSFADVVATLCCRAVLHCASACRQHSPTCVHGLLHDRELLQLGDTFACAQ